MKELKDLKISFQEEKLFSDLESALAAAHEAVNSNEDLKQLLEMFFAIPAAGYQELCDNIGSAFIELDYEVNDGASTWSGLDDLKNIIEGDVL